MASYFATLKASAETNLNETNAISFIRALLDREEYDSALNWADLALKSGISAPALHQARGQALEALNYPEKAASSYERALSLAPNEAELYGGLGRIYVERLGQYERAEQLFLQAIKINPDNQTYYLGLAESLIQRGLFREILPSAERKSDSVIGGMRLLSGIAGRLTEYGRYEEAQDCAEFMLSKMPDSPVALITLAMIAEDQRQDFNTGQQYLTKAIATNPDDLNCFYYYLAHLVKTGKWEQAQNVFKKGYQRMLIEYSAAAGEVSDWGGGRLQNKTILLDTKHATGYGDSIHFIRFAYWLKEQGARVGVASRKAIASLIASVPAVDFVIERHDERPAIDHVFDLSVLWLNMGVKMEDVGSVVPYLTIPLQRREFWKKKIPATSKINVGITWKSSPVGNHNRYTARSMPITEMAPLWNIPELQLYNLQKEGLPEELNLTSGETGIIDLSSDLGDFANTAAAVSELDIIVTVDTYMAHLAGALGKLTFILLPYSANWRWLLNRSDSPWYPNARLFRQEKAGSWKEVIQEVVEAVNNMSMRRANSPAVGTPPINGLYNR